MTAYRRAPTHHREVPASPPTGGIKRPARKPHRTEPLPGWKPEIARARSRVPLITVATVGILLVAVIGKLLLSFVAAHGVHFERERLKADTHAIGSSLDINQIKALTGQPADEQAPAFKALVSRLIEFRTAHREVRFNYLMGRNGSTVVFLLDSTDPASSDYSPPGQVYEEASPELVRSFTTGEPFVEGPVTDRWGTWVSGLAPIKDPSSGQVIAVMGMDVDATRWQVTLGVSRLIAYLIIGLLLGVVVFFARRVHSLQ
jgi:hypothetical protein